MTRFSDQPRCPRLEGAGLDGPIEDRGGREALEVLLEREIGPQAKDTIVTVGQQLIEQGRKQGIVRSLSNIYEARFGAMPEGIRAVIEATHDEPALLRWLTLAGTRGVDEVTAAIRASRAS